VPLVAYRFAQEALTNISKHAQASRVVIDLSLARGVLSLEVSDNGRGIRPADLDKARGFGLRGLRERAGTVGGWVDIAGGEVGTTLLLSVPVRGPAASRAGPETDFDDTNQAHDPSAWGQL
jgi:signal transduction histidine kinase